MSDLKNLETNNNTPNTNVFFDSNLLSQISPAALSKLGSLYNIPQQKLFPNSSNEKQKAPITLENISKEAENLIKKSDNILSPYFYSCPDCGDLLEFSTTSKGILSKCPKNHSLIISIANAKEMYKELTKNNKEQLTCSYCNSPRKVNNIPFYYCLEENKYFCGVCEGDYHYNLRHKTLNSYERYSFCFRHKAKLTCFCSKHLENCCVQCVVEGHKDCAILQFTSLIPKQEKISEFEKILDTYKDSIKKEEEKYIEYLTKITEMFAKLKNNVKSLIDFYSLIFTTFNMNKYNYYFIANLNFLINNKEKLQLSELKLVQDLKKVLNDLEANEIKNDVYFTDDKIYNPYQPSMVKIKVDVFKENKEITVEGKTYPVKSNVNRKIYFLYDKSNDAFEDPEKDYDNYSELDSATMFIDYIKAPFMRSFKFSVPGEHVVIYKFKKPINTCKLMFACCYHITSIEFINCDVSKCADFSNMFYGCKSLKSVRFGCADSGNVVDMSGMFNFCFGLEKVDLSSLSTKNVEDFGNMFHCCFTLREVNLDNFETAKAVSFKAMFSHCISLTRINLRNFLTDNVRDISKMFNCCKNLSVINMSRFNMDHTVQCVNTFEKCLVLSKIIAQKEFVDLLRRKINVNRIPVNIRFDII